ncbi:hypothetical protein CLAIMM_14959 [Cladophialophora immunda]|nr:hypothetical protein CLAIMM_14959 [Cladophialophora immunda]
MALDTTAVEVGSSRGDIDTSLNYYLDPALGGHSSFEAGTAGYFRRKFDERPVRIHDIRGHSDDFDVSKQGFQLVKHTSVEKEYLSDEGVKRIVYPEVEKLLKKVTGATRVHVFSHITRRDSRDKLELDLQKNSAIQNGAKVTQVTPAHYIHIDQSTDGALEVLCDNMPAAEVDQLVKTRWSIINVWRPINGPVIKDPLAVCDARTVRDDELIPVTANLPAKGTGMKYSTITAGKRFELFYAKYNPEHQWYYASGMTSDEVLLIKCFDSISDGETARRVPHSAFIDPKTKDLDLVRESVEVRSLVFYEDQPNE